VSDVKVLNINVIASKIEHVVGGFVNACRELCHQIRSTGHCLHAILPPVTRQCFLTCQRAHTFVLASVVVNILRIHLLTTVCLNMSGILSLLTVMLHACLLCASVNWIGFDWMCTLPV